VEYTFSTEVDVDVFCVVSREVDSEPTVQCCNETAQSWYFRKQYLCVLLGYFGYELVLYCTAELQYWRYFGTEKYCKLHDTGTVRNGTTQLPLPRACCIARAVV